MTIADDLKTSNDAFLAHIQTLETNATELNTKVDNLIVVANTTKDALVALQQQGGATPAQIQAVIDAQTAALTGVDAAAAAATAESTKADAAATAVAP